MSIKSKPVESLTISDIEANPVWKYVNRDQSGETAVRPVKRTPVANLTGKLVGTMVQFANGSSAWAIIGNVDCQSPRMTEHFLTISVERGGKWFTLSRYHDFDYSQSGPEALSNFLRMDVDQVFPISYDLRPFAKGDAGALVGKIAKEPREKLTRSQIIAMAVPQRGERD